MEGNRGGSSELQRMTEDKLPKTKEQRFFSERKASTKRQLQKRGKIADAVGTADGEQNR
jgi:hypothetical protein